MFEIIFDLYKSTLNKFVNKNLNILSNYENVDHIKNPKIFQTFFNTIEINFNSLNEKYNNKYDIIFDLSENSNKLDMFVDCWDNLDYGGFYIAVYENNTNNNTQFTELINCIESNRYMKSISTEYNTKFLYNVSYLSKHIINNKIYVLLEKKIYKNIDKVENIVIIPSLINIINNPSIFSREQRYEQTKVTIASIKEKIPNCFICFIDATVFNSDEKKFFKDNVDLFINCDNITGITNIVYWKKHAGENTYTLYAFDALNNIAGRDGYNQYNFAAFSNLKNIFKLGGRYYLNSTFSYTEYNNEYNVIKIVEPHIWSNKAAACFYKICKNYIQDYILFLRQHRDALNNSEDSSIPCEHILFSYITHCRSIVKNPSNLGVTSIISYNGEICHG